MQKVLIINDQTVNLEQIQDIMEEFATACADFASAVKRIDAKPFYGRDARNLGVDDGYSYASNDDEFKRIYERAQKAAQYAVELGLLKEIPYDLKTYWY